MKLNGIYIIKDDKNNVQWEISSYADLYNKLDLDIFSDLSQKGRDIIVHGLNDDDSREYIEGYLKNKQVYESCKQIDLKGIAEMLSSIRRMDISEKTGITPTSLSKLARGIKKMNPDKDRVQVTELRNVRFNTILMLSNYYDKYYQKSNKATKNNGETVKKIVVGNIYHCQNCGFGVTGSKFCPNCGSRIEY